MLKTNCINN